MTGFLRFFWIAFFWLIAWCTALYGQSNRIYGEVRDALTGETLIGANITVEGTTDGTVSDVYGNFELRTNAPLPIQLNITYVGFARQEIIVESDDRPIAILLSEDASTTEVIEVRGQRISERQRSAPLTIESLDAIAIRQTASDNFYDGLGSLKGVDLTTASLGFKIVNTRGFNSTSPVRTLQIIDGIDNQAPGLNFSLGNFLGAPELDILKVDLIVGASSAFYGPNAFNGVISMETRSPFFHKGLAAQVKGGERNLLETAMRYADVIKKDGNDFVGFKFNLFYLRADDWVANNYDPIDGSRVPASNPGRYDAVNIYGDEYFPLGDKSSPSNQWGENAGLGIFYRTGYREADLVDYDTRNIKASAAVHIRTRPIIGHQSPELIVGSNFGFGTTVYQGDNRFSLKNIRFFQQRLEYRKQDQFFIRAYTTKENAGDSYDPYFTALRLLEEAKTNEAWANDYVYYWKNQQIGKQMEQMGYPTLQFDFTTIPPTITFDYDAAEQWLFDNNEQLAEWHGQAEQFANQSNRDGEMAYLVPGTPEFDEAFHRITTSLNNDEESGTRFYSQSALHHVHGEYKFTPSFADEWVVGANGRMYAPDSRGTIFSDSETEKIRNLEFGMYTGLSRKWFNQQLTTSATVRVDKNENFPWIATPAASLVYKPTDKDYLRLSFSAGIRNPTLSDQYLNLNVGRAILAGNLTGVDSLITIESFEAYRKELRLDSLRYFSIDPVRPEKVRTIELGYRTTLFNSLFLDAGYYYSIYYDFLGYNIGIEARFDPASGLPEANSLQVYRYAANSLERVQTQGFAIGLNYYFATYYMLSGNYSWNKLITQVDDPIVPAFNTPEHKFNISISGRGIDLGFLNDFGFNVNYKWIDGFVFEGSPQFTGTIPRYQLLDAQINWRHSRINTTIKIGASNLLDQRVYQTYGGPRIGRLAYISFLYDWKKR